MEQKRLTASERESLLRLNVALEILINEPKEIPVRTAMVPYAKRDMAMMAAKIRKIMEGFAQTIPLEQMPIYIRALKMTSYTVGIKRPINNNRNDEYGMWLPFSVLNELLQGCHDHCLTCDFDKIGRMKCPLKKALDAIPNDVHERADGDCPYYTVI